MKPDGEKERFLDRQENVDRLLGGSLVCVLLVLVDLAGRVLPSSRLVGDHPWEHLLGF